jgi:hypothetical protein
VLQSLSDDGSDLSSLDSEEEALDYEAQLEEQLEDAYQQYLHRKGEQGKIRKLGFLSCRHFRIYSV